MATSYNAINPTTREKGVCEMETCEKTVLAKGLCPMHYARSRRRGDPTIAPKGRPNEWYGTAFKRCNKCGEVKERTADHWTKKSSSSDGLSSWCRPCGAQHQRDLWLTKTDHMRAKSRERQAKKRGLTPEQYEQMLAAQNGLCFLCDRPPNGKGGLHIDHDHDTGQVRALLCHSCNVGLGHFRDNLDTLRRALAYLEAGRTP